MASTMTSLFGPLDHKYCALFYYLSVFMFCILVFVIVLGIYVGIVKKKGFDHYISFISVAVLYFVYYLQNRLLYGMCKSSA